MMQIDRLTSVLLRRDSAVKKRPCLPALRHVPRRTFAKLEKLFEVMLPVHYMKLSPLRRTQRAQNRMVKQRTRRPKRASHCAMIASIATIFSRISLRTCSAGKPFGCTIAGALSPVGM